MKVFRLFLIAVTFIVLTSSVINAAEPADKQKAVLANIDLYMQAQRQNIEDYYTQRLALLDTDFQKRLQPFEAVYSDRNIRGSFFAWTTYIAEILQQNGIDLYKDRAFLETFRKFRNPAVPTRVRLDQAPRLLAIAQERLDREQVRITQLFAGTAQQIEREKKYAIEVQLSRLERRLIKYSLAESEPKAEGFISGIVYSEDKPAAYIGSKIIHKGDKIDKIQVVDITQNSIVLEKGGKRWTQKVGEKPSSQW